MNVTQPRNKTHPLNCRRTCHDCQLGKKKEKKKTTSMVVMLKVSYKSNMNTYTDEETILLVFALA